MNIKEIRHDLEMKVICMSDYLHDLCSYARTNDEVDEVRKAAHDKALVEIAIACLGETYLFFKEVGDEPQP